MRGLLVLLVCQLVGEFLVRLLGVPIPGPVVGMVVLFVGLRLRRPTSKSPVVRTADDLLGHLQLLFVPAGVGVIAYLPLVANSWLPLVGGLVIGWLAALGGTAAASAATLWCQARLATRAASIGRSR